MGATINRANIILGSQWGNTQTNVGLPNLFLALSIAPINKDGTGAKEPNIGVGGYARLQIANSTGTGGNFATPANAKVSNVKELSMAIFTGDLSVTGVTGDLYATHWFITDDLTSTDPGRVQWYGELKKRRPLVSDAVITFGMGELILEVEMPAT